MSRSPQGLKFLMSRQVRSICRHASPLAKALKCPRQSSSSFASTSVSRRSPRNEEGRAMNSLTSQVTGLPAKDVPPALEYKNRWMFQCGSMGSDVKALWKNADAVCFDVDSTVIKEEGIDELAKFCGKGDEVFALTKKAMGGSMSFRESLGLRLNIIKPTMHQIQEFIRTHPPTLSNHIKELVNILHRRRVDVYLVSGGFRSIISPVALQLNIPLQNIYANQMKFFYNGEFAGFDESSLTSSNGGKGKVIAELKRTFGYSNLVMIGDGATDLEACPPADAFIGYGGNVIREEVQKKAQWFVTDFRELIDALK